MTQRLATVEDIPALVEMGQKFHTMSPHASMGAYDPEAVARVIAFMIESPQSVVLTNGTGAIGATYAPIFFGPSQWLCEENFFFSEGRGGFDLLDGLIEHARGWGASHVSMSTLENAKAHVIDRLMTRKGFRFIERRYIKELPK
ncbi:MAG: hypothetical protein JWM16_6354 [Verrucomicrobiales bacterium]|nr:hypothetical protein [Verrucomicrobiales bacterium]